MITTVSEALTKLKNLPAMETIELEGQDEFITDILELTKRPNDSGQNIYRIYATAATLIELHPDWWLIKKHDRTELNTPEKLIKSLLKLQNLEDAQNGLIVIEETNPTITICPKIIG